MEIQAIIFSFEKAPDANMRKILCILRSRGYMLASNFACGACDVFVDIGNSTQREAYLKAAADMDVAPTACAVADGRGCDGINAAKECGMSTIGFGKAGSCIYADTCVNNFSELLDIFI